MNYTELCAAIESTAEDDFTADDIANFVRFAERQLYNIIEFPAGRKNAVGTTTASVPYLTAPSDYLFPHSMAIIDSSGSYHYLVNKDSNFIREAYPDPAVTGRPKHYALFDEDSFLLGPTPDQSYSVELHYGYYPESIVTAGTTWLGDNFEEALFNGAMVQAIRFMQGEPDMVQLYKDLFRDSIMIAKQIGDGRLDQDTYRSGQAKQQVV